MAANKKLLILSGDGIGPEVMDQVKRVIDWMAKSRSVSFDVSDGLIGGASIDVHGDPFTDETLSDAMAADAVLLGAVGGPQYESLARELRPERGLLGLRSELELFANLRPAILYPQLADASTLKPEIVAGLDIMIVRELTGGIYFGQPRGVRVLENGEKEGFNTLVYKESEINRIANVAFDIARKRNSKVCSVDKANVLECTELWRNTVTDLHKKNQDIELSHMYVDNAAMQLVRAPKQFDVMVTTNMFGDILSDTAAMLTGSIGMLPSASLNESGQGMYEPIHGSAPDIAGQNKCNPTAILLAFGMLLDHIDRYDVGHELRLAILSAIAEGKCTGDIGGTLGTREFTQEILDRLQGKF